MDPIWKPEPDLDSNYAMADFGMKEFKTNGLALVFVMVFVYDFRH